jgi:hypothetical protein
MKLRTLILSVLVCVSANAQERYKPSQGEIETLPAWAQLMYADNPNVFVVDQLYKSFYSENLFE